jgi:hypothetical protein
MPARATSGQTARSSIAWLAIDSDAAVGGHRDQAIARKTVSNLLSWPLGLPAMNVQSPKERESILRHRDSGRRRFVLSPDAELGVG